MIYLYFLLKVIIGVVILRYVMTPIITKCDYMLFVFPIIIYLLVGWFYDSSFIGVVAAVVSYFILYHFDQQQTKKNIKKNQNNTSNTYQSKGLDDVFSDPDVQFDYKAWFEHEVIIPENTKPIVKPEPQKPIISTVQGLRLTLDKVNKSIMRYSDKKWIDDTVKYWIEDIQETLEGEKDDDYPYHVGVKQYEDDTYFGELDSRGARSGYGCYMWGNGEIIFGEWLDNKKNGECIYANGKGYMEFCYYKENKRINKTFIRYQSGKTEYVSK